MGTLAVKDDNKCLAQFRQVIKPGEVATGGVTGTLSFGAAAPYGGHAIADELINAAYGVQVTRVRRPMHSYASGLTLIAPDCINLTGEKTKLLRGQLHT